MNISLRPACDEDFAFARDVYFATMRWIIESLFGWDQVREEENFARFFKLDEARIITAEGQNVGWIQEQVDDTSINLGSFYVMQEMQRRGIGTQVLRTLLAHAADQLELRLAKARGQVDQLTPSLLARAFAGQLVPQDPDDEPASKLLERLNRSHTS